MENAELSPVQEWNILLILTGGTICTSVENGLRSLSSDTAELRLTEDFRKSDSRFAGQVVFTPGRKFNTLSENMTVAVWNEILSYLRGMAPDFTSSRVRETSAHARSGKTFDGIIIAHGTDTLAYTAALFALMLSGCSVPVFLVSSNAPLEMGEQIANGSVNFRAAVECVCGGMAPGVYVPYRNCDGRVWLHLAARLTQCGNYSEDFFSAGAIDITGFPHWGNGVFRNLHNRFPFHTRGNEPLPEVCQKKPLLCGLPGDLTDCVLKMTPYVGMNYRAYHLNGYRAVLHGTYHSGTACTGNDNTNPHSILYLIDRCTETGTDIYISPARETADGGVYDTVPVMLHHGGGKLRPLYGMTDEMTYAKLLIAYSHPEYFTPERREAFLTCDFCGEMLSV